MSGSAQPGAPDPDDWWMDFLGYRPLPAPSTPTVPNKPPPAPSTPPAPSAPPMPPAPATPPAPTMLSSPPGFRAPTAPAAPPMPPAQPAPPTAPAATAAQIPDDDDDQEEDDVDPLRLRGADLLPEWWRKRLNRPAQPEQTEPPDCPHARTVPVHAQPTGEHVASICLDCDEQLDIPDLDAEVPSSRPAAPSKPGRPGGRKKTPSGKTPTLQATPSRSYVKPLLFTASAGAFGYVIGLVDAIGAFLPAADHQATDAIGLTLACAGGYGTWRVLGVQGVVRYLPGGIIGRVVASVFAAYVAPGLAPDGVQILNQYGAYAGLDASGIALLSTSAAICGGLYWLIDRRFKASPALVRWFVRVPLASALVAVAWYGPGPR